MHTLFPNELYPPGFELSFDFITRDEERFLCERIRQTELHTFMFHGFEAKRRVASFGHDYSFDQRKLAQGRPVPPEFGFLTERIALKLGIAASELEELLITEYPVGAVINWHRDAPPFDIITGVSLASDCTFRLRPYDKSIRGKGSTISVPLPRRSLYIMQGESREQWEHSIPALRQVRYSVTVRTLRKR
jgi:alkylated DNA repair dioxygenase AlkB